MDGIHYICHISILVVVIIEKEVEIVNDFSYSICQEVSARDSCWSESSSAILSGLALALMKDSKCEEQVHFNSLYNLLVYHGSKTLNNKKIH